MLLDLLKKRYSCRNFSDRAIPEEVIRYILECGRLSASGGNEQPWKFGVITDRELIRRISAAASVNYNQDWIAAAPLIIVLCTQLFDLPEEQEIGMNRFPSFHKELQRINRRLYETINMEEHQTKIPGEHMVLAGLEHGIYSTWVSSVDCEEVGKIIGIRDYIVSNVLVFGYPDRERAPRQKKDIKDIVFINSFENTGI